MMLLPRIPTRLWSGPNNCWHNMPSAGSTEFIGKELSLRNFPPCSRRILGVAISCSCSRCACATKQQVRMKRSCLSALPKPIPVTAVSLEPPAKLSHGNAGSPGNSLAQSFQATSGWPKRDNSSPPARAICAGYTSGRGLWFGPRYGSGQAAIDSLELIELSRTICSSMLT